MARLVLVLLVLGLLAAACEGDVVPVVEVEEARVAEVTETVAAPGTLAPAASEQVVAGVAGTISAIMVADGEAVAGGDVVLRLASSELDDALAQVDEARAALTDMAAPVAFDPGPLRLGPPPAATLPGLPDVDPGNPAEEVVAVLDAQVRPKIAEARTRLPPAVDGLRAALAGAQAALDAWVEEVLRQLPPDVAADVTLPEHELPALPDGTAIDEALDGLEDAYAETRAGLLAAGAAAAGQQAAATEQLAVAARDVAAGMEETLGAAVGEVAAAQAAAQQALLAAVQQQTAGAVAAQAAELDATAERLAAQAGALVVEAPFDGLVELAPAAAAAPDLGPLGGLGGDMGAGLGLGAGGLGDLGGNGSAGGGSPLRVGARVRAGQPLFTVYDVSTWYVDAEIDEIDAPAVTAGQRAEVRIDAFPGEVFDGVVESMRLAARSSFTGAVVYPTRVRLLDQPGARVGMTASVDITTDVVDADLAVPSRAVVRRDGANAVYVVRAGRAEIVAVTVRALGEDLAAVEGPLAVGEPVVVRGYEELPDGAEVEVE